MKVTLYTKPNCPQCEATKRDMDILGIEYQTVDISAQPGVLDSLIERGFRAAPVVETDAGTWAGYDQERIKALVEYA